MSRSFNLWLLAFLVQAIIILVAGYFGFFKMLFMYDITYLGFSAFVLWLAASVTVGMRAYGYKPAEDWQWFASEQFMYIGLLGTAIGIVHGLTSLVGLDPSDTAATMSKMLQFVTGIASALLVTISTILTSSFMKTQLVIIDHCSAKEEVRLEDERISRNAYLFGFINDSPNDKQLLTEQSDEA